MWRDVGSQPTELLGSSSPAGTSRKLCSLPQDGGEGKVEEGLDFLEGKLYRMQCTHQRKESIIAFQLKENSFDFRKVFFFNSFLCLD